MGAHLGTPGAAGMGSDLDAAQGGLDSVDASPHCW